MVSAKKHYLSGDTINVFETCFLECLERCDECKQLGPLFLLDLDVLFASEPGDESAAKRALSFPLQDKGCANGVACLMFETDREERSVKVAGIVERPTEEVDGWWMARKWKFANKLEMTEL